MQVTNKERFISMRVNNNPNNPSFQGSIGKIEAGKILNKFGQKTLDEIAALAPRIINEEKTFGDKSYKYSFKIHNSGCFEVNCGKLFERNYPEAKTKLGKMLTVVKKILTSEYECKSATHDFCNSLSPESLTIYAKKVLSESSVAKSFEEKDRLLAFNSKIKEIKKQ